jgi:hypothetical protein
MDIVSFARFSRACGTLRGVVVEVGLLQIATFSPGTQQTSTIGDVKLDHLVHSFQRGQVEDTIQSLHMDICVWVGFGNLRS